MKFAIMAGTTLESTRACIELAERYSQLYAGVGIHPCEAHEPVTDTVYAELEALARSSAKVVCISEVGLDYLPESPDHEVQDQVFRQHIRLAKSLKMPIIFHLPGIALPPSSRCSGRSRPATVGGAMHYFQGRRSDGAGSHRLRLLHFLGPAPHQASRSTGSGPGGPAGAHCPGDRRRASAFQEVPPQLDGTPPRGRRRPMPGRRQGHIRGRGRRRYDRQPEANVERRDHVAMTTDHETPAGTRTPGRTTKHLSRSYPRA